jgi:hypothetical protein
VVALAGDCRTPPAGVTRLKQSEELPIALHRHHLCAADALRLLFTAAAGHAARCAEHGNNPALLLTCLLGAASCQSVPGVPRAQRRRVAPIRLRLATSAKT